MKKWISVLLSITIITAIFPVVSFAKSNTFKDVTGDEYYAVASDALSQLDILAGYPDGTFGPEKSITRAEMAAVIVRMLGMSDEATDAEGKTRFDDVASNHWASGYIKVATDEKIIVGDGDGKFRPDDNVKYEEAIKMVVCAAGLESEAKADSQDWSAGYIDVAQKHHISDNLTGSKGKASSRGDVSVMVYNALVMDLAAPTASKKAGSYTGTQKIELSTTTKDAEIYYTTDGSAPTVKSTKYTKAISVTKTTTIRAIAVLKGVLVSDEFKGDYTIKISGGGGGSHSGGGGGGSSGSSTYTVSFDLNYDGATDVPQKQSVEKGDTAVRPQTPVRDGYMFIGWFIDKDLKTEYDFDAEVIENITLYAKWRNNDDDDLVDSDNDGVDDDFETYWDANPTLDDTDGDGLTDYVEIFESFTNPSIPDTDGNGILDSNEDYDGDGLANIEEQNAGTRSDVVDTDGDGLSDYDEIKIHGTNPLEIDTDSDSLTDYDEIQLGLDPLNPMSNGTTPDGERTFVQITDQSAMDESLANSDNWLKPSISGNVAGLISKNIHLYESSIYSFDGNRSVVSDIIDVEDNYETPVTLSFSYERAYTGDMNNLTIATYDEDAENGLTIIETTIDEASKTISGDIIGNSTYFVIDLDEFLKGLGIDVFGSIAGDDSEEEIYSSSTLFANEIDNDIMEADSIPIYDNDGSVIGYASPEPTMNIQPFLAKNVELFAAPTGATGKADVVFVIDTTGSMSGAISGVKNNVNLFSKALVEDYNIDANFALIEYRDIIDDGESSTKLHKSLSSNWFTNVNSFADEVNSLRADGGGDYDETPIDGLGMARLIDWRSDAAKFVILVTDAGFKINNRYGISGMDEMARLLAQDDIITSVIADNSSTYKSLTEMTDGLYGYIYDNFSDILLQLAIKVGEATNTGGEWVFLDDYQSVKLTDTLENAKTNDSDEDGLMDADELGTSKYLNMQPYIDLLLNRASLPKEAYEGKTLIQVWKYKSNPTLVDTDFDGISDGPKDYDGSAVVPDISPRRASILKGITGEYNLKNGNYFKGNTTANDFNFDVNFLMDYTQFFEDLNSYNRILSKLGIVYSLGAYGNKINITSGTSVNGDDEELMKAFGMKGVKSIKLADMYTDDDISEISIGHREVTYQGIKRDIIIIPVRGTDATIEEWSSNFDVGADIDEYWDRNNTYWREKQHHKGFDVAANRLYDEIKDYLDELNPRTPKILYFTGHSRGAAIANILSAKFTDEGYTTTSYNFATPNTTLKSNVRNYTSIYNIVNRDDLVPFLPLGKSDDIDGWGFDKYGKVYTVSIEEEYEDKFGKYDDGTWEAMFNYDYNYNGNLKKTLKAFSKLANTRDDLYKFTGEDNTFYTYGTKYASQQDAENAAQNQANKYGTRISKFCEFYTLEKSSWGSKKYQVSIEQCPAAMMMIITDVVASKMHQRKNGKDEIVDYNQRGAGEDSFFGQHVGFYVAKKYADAKEQFVWSGADSASDLAMKVRMGGMLHSHMPGTYYLIANDSKNLIP